MTKIGIKTEPCKLKICMALFLFSGQWIVDSEWKKLTTNHYPLITYLYTSIVPCLAVPSGRVAM